MPKLMPAVWIEEVSNNGRQWFVVVVDARSDYRDRLVLGEGATEQFAIAAALACAREIADRVAVLELERLARP